jgi:alkanesulfonate monooxygenase SsuD/methylene tetrahydromethanopterin reductase-like flavin-dependent oxidoreductase (luciferase family)
VAATSPDTFPTIGAQGHAIFAAVRTGTLSELAPHISAYRTAYAQAGHRGKGEVFLRIPVYIADSLEQARADTEASILQFYRQLGQQLEASAKQAGARDIEQRDVRGRRLQELTFEDLLRDKVLVGTPEMVSERLRGIADELGLDGILAELNSGGQVPRDGVKRSLQLLCDEVMPAFGTDRRDLRARGAKPTLMLPERPE